MRRSPSGASAVISAATRPLSSNSSSGRYERIHASSAARCSGFSASFASGTWWARKVPSIGWPSTSLGPVQPLGVRRTIIGQRGRSAAPSRARDWMARDVADHLVERLGHELVHGRRVVALDEVGLVAVADEQRAQLVVRDARQHGRVGDLVAVEVQDRQHRAVARRVRRTCWSASSPPAGRSRPRRRPRRSRRAGRGCRTPLRRRGPARSRARRPRGSSPASRARRGWGCRPGRRTAGTAGAGPPRRASCSGRPRCSVPSR